MHICIPDTREVRPQHGSAYLLYNIHIDGLYHCSMRYKQLHHLHQALSKRFPSGNPEGVAMPSFPPKKLLPLTVGQVEDRRQLLEKYLQNISQDKQINNSSLFNMYLLEAQRESTSSSTLKQQMATMAPGDGAGENSNSNRNSSSTIISNKHVHLDIELVNGQKIRLPIVTHDSVDSVLTACCRALGLADKYHAYFCLCLCGYDVVSDKLIIKRRLSFFEAPFITLQMAIQQQEQLQSVLSAATSHAECRIYNPDNLNSHHHHHHHHHDQIHNNHHHHHRSSLTNSSSSSISNDNLNNNSNPCRCLSCSSSSSSSSSSPIATTTTTGVPSVSSSQQQQQQYLSSCCHNNNSLSNTTNGNSANNTSSTSSSGRSSFVTHRILLRKSYWDPIYDSYILSDSQALSLLFIQTVYDMKHSLMFVDRSTYSQLESLLASDSKLEYILLARTLKYYNYVHFEPCYSDYPRPRTKVMISIGSKELNMRVLKSPARLIPTTTAATSTFSETPSCSAAANAQHRDHDEQDQVLYCTSSLVGGGPQSRQPFITKGDLIEEEYNFKVPLIRCWRLTSLETLNSNNGMSAQHQHRQAPVATTTTLVAGGKRKSLSLFNSVLGNANTAHNNNNNHLNRNDDTTRAVAATGIGGTSLMATLMAHSGDNNDDLSSKNNHSNHPSSSGGVTTAAAPTNTTNTFTNNGSSSGGTSNSFLRFSSNSNQMTTSNNTTYNNYPNSTCQHYYDDENCTASSHQQQQQPPRHHYDHQTQLSQYELSFEYLIAKDTLKWITISSDQAIFISISLQGVVDELVSKRDMGLVMVSPTNHHPTQLITPSPAGAISRPIAIQQHQHQRTLKQQQQQQQQVAESFTYLYRDGGQKSIKAKSQQQLIDRFYNGLSGALGGPLSSAPSSSSCPSTSSAAGHALGARQRNKSEHSEAPGAILNSSTGSTATSASGSSNFLSSPPRRSSILQAASFWGSSPPGRYYGHLSSSGNYNHHHQAGVAPGQPRVAPFEFGSHYHCNARHASHNHHQNGKFKVPSPIINDAFEGVVSNDDDF